MKTKSLFISLVTLTFLFVSLATLTAPCADIDEEGLSLRYDFDSSGLIERPEAVRAAQDFMDSGNVSRTAAAEVVTAYLSSEDLPRRELPAIEGPEIPRVLTDEDFYASGEEIEVTVPVWFPEPVEGTVELSVGLYVNNEFQQVLQEKRGFLLSEAGRTKVSFKFTLKEPALYLATARLYVADDEVSEAVTQIAVRPPFPEVPREVRTFSFESIDCLALEDALKQGMVQQGPVPFELMGRNFPIIVTKAEEVAEGVRMYRGEIAEIEGSQVALAFSESGVHGRIYLNPSISEGREWFFVVEPLAMYIPSEEPLPSSSHIAYTLDNVISVPPQAIDPPPETIDQSPEELMDEFANNPWFICPGGYQQISGITDIGIGLTKITQDNVLQNTMQGVVNPLELRFNLENSGPDRVAFWFLVWIDTRSVYAQIHKLEANQKLNLVIHYEWKFPGHHVLSAVAVPLVGYFDYDLTNNFSIQSFRLYGTSAMQFNTLTLNPTTVNRGGDIEIKIGVTYTSFQGQQEDFYVKLPYWTCPYKAYPSLSPNPTFVLVFHLDEGPYPVGTYSVEAEHDTWLVRRNFEIIWGEKMFATLNQPEIEVPISEAGAEIVPWYHVVRHGGWTYVLYILQWKYSGMLTWAHNWDYEPVIVKLDDECWRKPGECPDGYVDCTLFDTYHYEVGKKTGSNARKLWVIYNSHGYAETPASYRTYQRLYFSPSEFRELDHETLDEWNGRLSELDTAPWNLDQPGLGLARISHRHHF